MATRRPLVLINGVWQELPTADVMPISALGAGTANRVLITDASGNVIVSPTISDTELGYLDGVTSALQTQVDAKQLNSNLVTPVQCSAQLTKTSDTTYSDVAGLSITVPSTGYWWVDLLLDLTVATSPGIKIQLTGPTFTVLGVDHTFTYISALPTTAEILNKTGTTLNSYGVRALINVTNVTGALKVQAAQSVTSATSTVVKVASRMSMSKVA